MANGRGGARLGAGRKKKVEATGHRLQESERSNQITDLGIPLTAMPQIDDCPEPNEYLTRKMRGINAENRGKKILQDIWRWLKVRDCEKLVNPENLQLWALQVSKYEQCVEAEDQFSFLQKNASGVYAISPFEVVAEKLLRRAATLWAGIEVMIADRVKFYADRTGDDKSPLDRLLNLSATRALNADDKEDEE
jgi:hypothetical protein